MDRNSFSKDIARLDSQRVRSEAYTATIIKDQETLIETANDGIARINVDLKSLRRRLEPYANTHPIPMDSKYNDLKFRYETRLKERVSLEKARVMAEESLTAAKLHLIPGETSRIPKAPNEPGYHGLK